MQYVIHAAEEMERTVKLGYSEDGGMTFEDYANRWLERQTKYAPGTLANYRKLLNVTYPYIGTIKVEALRPIALENMLIDLRKRKHHGKQIQEKTVQKYLTAVSVVLSDAKRNEIIPKNPAHMVTLPEVKNVQQYIPSRQEVSQIISIIRKEPPHFAFYYLLAIYTGCRRGELCALKWSDFSEGPTMSEMVLTVNRSRTRVSGLGIIEGPTKNRKARTIILDSSMTSLFQNYLSFKQAEAKRRRRKLNPYLFVDGRGNLVCPDRYSSKLRQIYNENGFPECYHLHTLRHYFVSSMLHSGVDKQTVAELVGHGDTSFLERTYCHPQMEQKEIASRVMMGNMFSVHQSAS